MVRMISSPPPQLLINMRADKLCPSAEMSVLLGKDAPAIVRQYLGLCPRHAATPLRRLDALAKAHGIAAIAAKDEGHRLGLHSFKALGGAYAVARLVAGWASSALGRQVAPSELLSPEVKAAVANRTVTSATDGNHGRSVAAGAKLFGCRAVIFVHKHVAEERRAAMAAFGARIIEVDGNYDDSVTACTCAAEENGWQVVSDTSWPGYEEIPGWVMQGYTVMVDEALAQLVQPPTHVFIQGGVGGVAAAVAGHLADRFGADRPRVIVVEPAVANCLLQSARAGKPITIPAGPSSIMGMLECYTPSGVAWPILNQFADAFMDLPEDAAPDIMRRLAGPLTGDDVIVSGESGGAGLAGLLAVLGDADHRKSLGLDATSRALVFITEGATGPAAYQAIVGRSAETVASAGRS
jgi:diaminopropionate ammonia-lyase